MLAGSPFVFQQEYGLGEQQFGIGGLAAPVVGMLGTGKVPMAVVELQLATLVAR